jgi:hypothetical protein
MKSRNVSRKHIRLKVLARGQAAMLWQLEAHEHRSEVIIMAQGCRGNTCEAGRDLEKSVQHVKMERPTNSQMSRSGHIATIGSARNFFHILLMPSRDQATVYERDGDDEGHDELKGKEDAMKRQPDTTQGDMSRSLRQFPLGPFSEPQGKE